MQPFSLFCIYIYEEMSSFEKINNFSRMKNNTIKDLLVLGVFVGFAYFVSRYYQQKKQKEKELRESLHFQLF